MIKPKVQMKVKLTFVDSLLGTASGDPELHESYIASKAPDAPSREEEVAAIGVDESVAKGKTVFPRDPEGNPIMWSYQIKGFLKSACKALRDDKDTKSSKLKAYKKQIDQNVFVWSDIRDKQSRMIPIMDFDEIRDCQRPLRASTPMGERVAIADSEEIPAGATITFWIEVLGDKTSEAMIREWMDYGIYNGLGQWRNSGKGAFTWEELTE